MSTPLRHQPPEPEIIPPGEPLPRRGAGVWVASGPHGIRTGRIGSAGVALVALAVGVVGALALAVLIGMAIISLIAGGLLAVGFILAGILRKASQPLR